MKTLFWHLLVILFLGSAGSDTCARPVRNECTG